MSEGAIASELATRHMHLGAVLEEWMWVSRTRCARLIMVIRDGLKGVRSSLVTPGRRRAAKDSRGVVVSFPACCAHDSLPLVECYGMHACMVREGQLSSRADGRDALAQRRGLLAGTSRAKPRGRAKAASVGALSTSPSVGKS